MKTKPLTHTFTWPAAFTVWLLTSALGLPAFAQGTAFTYQGRLNDGTNAANGLYDFQCSLYYAPSGELPLMPPPLPNPAVGVTNGLFTMAIGFTGPNPFNGQSLWLELQVRTNGSGSYTTLAPRQKITPTPYASYATIAGIATTASSAGNFSGALAGDVMGTQSATTVGRIRGVNVSLSEPSPNQHLRFDGANWAPGAVALGTDVSGTLPLASGGTGAGTVAQAVANLGASSLTASNTFSGVNAMTNVANSFVGAFAGNGAGLTNVPAASLPANVAYLGSNQTFTASNTFTGVVTATNPANQIVGSHSGSGAGLTSLNPANLTAGTAGINISGNAATASSATSATSAGSFTGSLGGDVTGPQGATIVGSVGGQSAANVAGGASAANAATSANTPNTIVKRDASGSFNAGGVTGTNFTGNGANLTNLNASQLSNGTVPDARLSNNLARLNLNQTFAGANTFNQDLSINGNLWLQGALNMRTDLTLSQPAPGLEGAQMMMGDAGVASPNGATAWVIDNYGTSPNASLRFFRDNAPGLTLSTNALTYNNGTLYADGVNNRVGIGTTTPATPLEIRSATTAGPTLRLTGVGGSGAKVGIDLATYDPVANGTTNAGARIEAMDDNWSAGIDFQTKSPGSPANSLASRLYIQNSGNVGLGTTSPRTRLDVRGPVALSGAGANLDFVDLSPYRNSGTMLIGWNRTIGGGETDFIASRIGGGLGGFSFYDLADDGTLSQLLSIQGNGKVGVGISAPSAKLDVAGNVKATAFIGDGSQLTGIATAMPPPGMVLIPAGAFTMGNSIGDSDITDATPISTTVSAFYMDVNLVSWSQWQSVYFWATNHGYSFVNAGAGKAPNHPVQTVDWYDCVKWCNARSQQVGKTPVYYTDAGLTLVYTNGQPTTLYPNWGASGYRLPTEAEWEKAARGGLSGQRFPWGNVTTENLANYYGATALYSYDLGPDGYNSVGSAGGISPATSPVGSFAANGFGLYDMAGNVLEWCWDWYGTPYAGGSDPNGAGGPLSWRVQRGGYYYGYGNGARCASRYANIPGYAAYDTGFRCVRGF